MTNPSVDLRGASTRGNWVRLRTLAALRWIAISVQLIAVLASHYVFELRLELGFMLAAIGLAATVNLVSLFVYPENRRLTETELAAHLVFDLTQLALLLYLGGGLSNPFAVLFLVSVTVSATALHARTTLALGCYAVVLITFLARAYIPLEASDGEILQMPRDFQIGFWIAMVLGIIFLATFAQRVTSEVHAMSDALAATQMALAREQKLTDLGGVVAAAAHELGTPLATIKLVSSELRDEVGAMHPDLLEDIDLISDQADRCRVILRSMGRAGKEDTYMKLGPISAVVREAAEPHGRRGIQISYDVSALVGEDPRQPVIYRTPEVVHGIRNLVQNAVDFARSEIWVDIHWSQSSITLRIVDDGPGFPPSVMSRIGDPFVRYRRGNDLDLSISRPGYEGMGLGLFIAKTLLERSGAELAFANGHDPYSESPVAGTRTGAVVNVTWPQSAIAADPEVVSQGMGENRPIEA